MMTTYELLSVVTVQWLKFQVLYREHSENKI